MNNSRRMNERMSNTASSGRLLREWFFCVGSHNSLVSCRNVIPTFHEKLYRPWITYSSTIGVWRLDCVGSFFGSERMRLIIFIVAPASLYKLNPYTLFTVFPATGKQSMSWARLFSEGLLSDLGGLVCIPFISHWKSSQVGHRIYQLAGCNLRL